MTQQNKKYVCINGGLGNQMFGYAFYKYLCFYKKIPVVPSYIFLFRSNIVFASEQAQTLLCDVFTIDIIKHKKYRFNKRVQFFKKIWYLYNKHICKNIYKEKHLYFYDDTIELTKKYFIGYFQSYKYVDPVRDIVLQDFQLKNPLSAYAQHMQKQIQTTPNSVAIHIRRGDYLSGYNGYYNILDTDYYTTAWEQIVTKYPDAQPFIFSQDTQWVHQNLSFLPNPVFVTPDKDLQYEDMVLMSNCSHNIIANSSYSWWGAYLNKNPHKIVICPNHWTQHLRGTDALTDLIPPDWNII